MKNKKRICPDCHAREVEKNCVYCSECVTIRKYLSNAKYAGSEKGKQKAREYFQKTYTKKPRKTWGAFRRNATPEQIKYFGESNAKGYYKQVNGLKN